MRRGSLSAGLRPATASPLDDDLARPWRQWWGIKLCADSVPVRRPRFNRPAFRKARYWGWWGASFFLFHGSQRRILRHRGSRL